MKDGWQPNPSLGLPPAAGCNCLKPSGCRGYCPCKKANFQCNPEKCHCSCKGCKKVVSRPASNQTIVKPTDEEVMQQIGKVLDDYEANPTAFDANPTAFDANSTAFIPENIEDLPTTVSWDELL